MYNRENEKMKKYQPVATNINIMINTVPAFFSDRFISR